MGGVKGTKYLLKIRNHAPRTTHHEPRTTHHAPRKANNSVPPLFFEKAEDNNKTTNRTKNVKSPADKRPFEEGGVSIMPFFSLRKHAYSNILKILPPKNEKFSDKEICCFSYFCSKHRLWVLVRTASTRRF